MARKKMIDVFPEWFSGGGIFTALQSLGVPWEDENIAQSLDVAYFGGRSGDKLIAPLITKIMDGDTLTSTERNTLASTIYNIFGVNWGKLWGTLSLSYNPIENYRMEETGNDTTTDTYGKIHTRTDDLSHAKTGTETGTPDLTDTRTDDLTHAKTGTETGTPDTTETTTPDLQNNTAHSVYGFDSDEAVPSGEEHTTATGNTTVTKTGTDTTIYNTADTDTGTQTVTHTGTDTMTYDTTETDTGTQTDADTGEDTHGTEHTLTRSGNIGVTTSQQMIQSERDLWMWNFFNNVVFKDLDTFLCLHIY